MRRAFDGIEQLYSFALHMQLYHRYGVKTVLGLRNGYRGLNPKYSFSPMVLMRDVVERIHRIPGTVLSTSRSEEDSTLVRGKIQQYFEEKKIKVNLKFIGPNYTIHNVLPNANDSIYCDNLSRYAVKLDHTESFLCS